MSELASSDNKTENAIDIFVFSNGEQNTPPRKYHLQLKEINMWKGTLRNLGNSHYGIVNRDIDIYTTDGRKVEGPSELGHLKAYVAVIPPCAFIQAGYDNYLIKASRSWEKRLLKITNSKESSIKDQKQTVMPKSDLIIESIENETQNQNEKEDNITDKTNNKAKATMLKSDSAKSKQIQEYNKAIKGPIGSKQIKKPTFTTETSTLKTQIFTPYKISSVAKRSVIKTKESLQIKSLAPKKGIPINMKRNTTRVPGVNNNCNKLGEKKIVPSIITNLNVLTKKSENSFSSQITPPSSKQTQDSDIKTILSNVESNIYKNTETEITSIAELKRNDILNGTLKNAIDNEVVSISDKSGRNTSTVQVQNKSSKLSMVTNESRKQIDSIETRYPVEKEPEMVREPSVITFNNCIPRQGPMDNFVAIVNNDKIFKLQFNLQIENCNVSVKKESEIKKTHSIKSILKEEKEIQVNMYEESNTVNERVHAHFPKDDTIKNLSDEGKIIIIHCSCFNDIDLNYLLQSNICHNEISQHDITPKSSPSIEEEQEMGLRCSCGIQPPNTKPEENFTAAALSNAQDEAKVSERLVISKTQLLQCNCTVDSETDRLGKGLNGLQQEEVTCSFTRLKYIDTRSTPEGNKLATNNINRHTQTSWCSIILQAVRHEGGRYSLHLPPLHTIKNMADRCE